MSVLHVCKGLLCWTEKRQSGIQIRTVLHVLTVDRKAEV